MDLRVQRVEPPMHLPKRVASATLAACAALAGGCATVREGGETTRVSVPGWEAIRDAVVESARQPAVWLPLAGAAVFQVDDWDRRTSNWARTHTPIFGSTASADQWSDRLRAVPSVAEVASILAVPASEAPGDWVLDKLELGAVDVAAVGSSMLADKALKSQTARLRPNGTDRESLPSGHATSAAANARVAMLNLETVPWDARAADWALDAAVIGTGWARVESGYHYPSDALVGIALGNFLAGFVHRSFVSRNGVVQQVTFVPDRDGARLRFRWTF